MNTHEVRTINIVNIPSYQKTQLVQLANEVSSKAEGYVESRFDLYEQAVIFTKNQAIMSFQLIQQFEVNDEDYIYFGPLFSKMNGYLSMFVEYFQTVLRKSPIGRKVNMLAEIQNYEVLLMYQVLFGGCIYPHIKDSTIPSHIKETATVFANTLTHINGFNSQNLSTFSSETLYDKTKVIKEIDVWLKARGIDFSNGDNQMVLLIIPPDQQGRDNVVHRLESGLLQTKEWRKTKMKMLKQFQKETMIHV